MTMTLASPPAAYLFDVMTGQQLFKLTASDAAAEDVFGGHVAVSGNTAIVGAVGNSDAGAPPARRTCSMSLPDSSLES